MINRSTIKTIRLNDEFKSREVSRFSFKRYRQVSGGVVKIAGLLLWRSLVWTQMGIPRIFKTDFHQQKLSSLSTKNGSTTTANTESNKFYFKKSISPSQKTNSKFTICNITVEQLSKGNCTIYNKQLYKSHEIFKKEHRQTQIQVTKNMGQ